MNKIHPPTRVNTQFKEKYELDFDSIREIRHEFIDLPYEEKFDVDAQNLMYDIHISFREVTEASIRLFLHIKFGYNHNNTAVQVTHSDYEFVFQYTSNFKLIINKKEENSAALLYHAFAIAVSTARGILYARNRGTFMDKYHLPLINCHELLDKAIQREKDQGKPHKKGDKAR